MQVVSFLIPAREYMPYYGTSDPCFDGQILKAALRTAWLKHLAGWPIQDVRAGESR
jgi:hypothetical protein